MPAIQLSDCENMCISFNRKHDKEMNGKNKCAYLGVYSSFLLDSYKTYCVHFQTIEHKLFILR